MPTFVDEKYFCYKFILFNRQGTGHQRCGSGSFGRPVPTNAKGPRFEFSQWQNVIMNIFTVDCLNDGNNKTEAWNDPFFKKKQ